MKNRYQTLLLLVITTILILSCSKEDDVQVINQNGGEIFRSQLVTVVFSGTNLSENEYQGTLDGAAVTLAKAEDNKLLFLVPYSTSLGLKDLIIPSLNNATIHYEVKDSVLSQTPQATMAPFFANLNIFSQTLTTSPEAVSVQNTLNSFTAVFDNASMEDQTKMAILYQSNKVLFDDIILNDFSTVTGRNVDPSDIQLLAKHSMAVYAVAAGAIVAIVAPDGVSKAFGVALVAVGAYKAREYFIQVLTKKLNTVNCAVNGIIGTMGRNTTETVLAFQNDVTRTVALQAKERGVIAGDATKTQSAVVSFFKDYNKYNYYSNKINTIITWVNNNVPFADFNQITLEQLASTSPEVSTNVNSEAFGNFTFSVNHPNLQLVSSSLQSDGQLNMKIKIIGTPTVLPVESFLNYNYSDEFSSFSGKLPIEVEIVPNLYIGMSYQGGKIAYIFQQGDPGFIVGEQHGIIAALQDRTSYNNQGLDWAAFRNPWIVVGASGIDLGTGLQNTEIINSSNGVQNGIHIRDRAPVECYLFESDGYGDWFLPSKNELLKLYENRGVIGGFYNTQYWSSTEFDADETVVLDFGNGVFYNLIKSERVEVRPVRYF